MIAIVTMVEYWPQFPRFYFSPSNQFIMILGIWVSKLSVGLQPQLAIAVSIITPHFSQAAQPNTGPPKFHKHPRFGGSIPIFDGSPLAFFSSLWINPSPPRPPMIRCFVAQNKRGKAWADIPPEAEMSFAPYRGGC